MRNRALIYCVLLLAAVGAEAQRRTAPGRTETSIRAGNTWPITLEANALTDSIHVDLLGRIGLGTWLPTAEFHLFDDVDDLLALIECTAANCDARLVLENDAQEWRLGVDGAVSDAFTVRDETGTTDRLLLSPAGALTVPALVSCDPLVTDGAGLFSCGSGGASHPAVTLIGTPDYITIDGSQVITRGLIDLAADVTGLLPASNIVDDFVLTAGDTMTGSLTLSSGSIDVVAGTVTIGNNQTLRFDDAGGTARAAMQMNAGNNLVINATGAVPNNVLLDLTSGKQLSVRDSADAALATWSETGFVGNQPGNDYDHRWEGLSDPNLLFLDAGNDRVGIGTLSPGTLAHFQTASSGGTPGLAGTVLTLENSASTYLQILADTAALAGVLFGDSGNDDQGALIYNFTDDSLLLKWNNAVRLTLHSSGKASLGTATESGQLRVDQASATGAVPVLDLDQGDIDDTFINFIGTSAADGSRSISSDTTEDAAKFGAFRVEVNGVTKWVRVYDDES